MVHEWLRFRQIHILLFYNVLSVILHSLSRSCFTITKSNSSYYDETDKHLKVRSGEHIGISSLTFRKVKPSKESAIRDHLLNCNNIPSSAEFTILTYGHHKYILKIKESLLITRNRPVLNKNISSTKLFLFHNN